MIKPTLSEGTLERLQPRNTWHLVQLLEPKLVSAGGIHLPETAVENWEDGWIVRSGWGRSIPDCPELWMQTEAGPGERVVFPKACYRPFWTGSRQGMVRDEDLMAIVDDAGDIWPANDWVLIELEPFAACAGAIHLPEEAQGRGQCGKVAKLGPGPVIEKGPLEGFRRGIDDLVGDALVGKRVWWGGGHDCWEIGRENVEYVLVRALDLLFVEEES